MTQQIINVGTFPNDGTGDPARTAFTKVNANFTELYNRTNVPIINPTSSPYNADPTGNNDSASAFNTAIAAAAAAGGGIILPTAGTYKIGSTITQASGVVVYAYGSTFTWSGGASTMVGMPATGATNLAGWFGGVLNDGGNASVMLAVASGFACWYRDIQYIGNSLTNICISLSGNSSGNPNLVGNLNTAHCYFENMSQCQSSGGNGNGTFINITGVNTSNGLSTDNTFNNCQAQRINAFGIVGGQACDSNIFAGMIRIGLNGNISPANGVGLAWGTTGAGVYSWTFQHLAIDTFGTPATDNRIGVLANFGNGPKNLKIGILFMGPQVEQNAFASANISSLLSADVTVAPRQTTNYQAKHLVGSTLGIGIQANTGATCISGAGAWLSGANQYTYFSQSTCFSNATALSANFGATPGAVAAAGPYTVSDVAGFLALPGGNGTNAAVTNGYGFYSRNQNFASTNIGVKTEQNANTANDKAFWASGTAPSLFAGPTAVGGSTTNDSASAGFVGETISSALGSGSAVALSTGTAANITTISLTAGDWDVTGQVAFLFVATTTVTGLAGGVNTVSATLPGFNTGTSQTIYSSFAPGAQVITQTVPRQRISLASTSTVFLIAQAVFAVSTLSAYGSITARRRR